MQRLIDEQVSRLHADADDRAMRLLESRRDGLERSRRHSWNARRSTEAASSRRWTSAGEPIRDRGDAPEMSGARGRSRGPIGSRSLSALTRRIGSDGG
jgi:hypothetical protein